MATAKYEVLSQTIEVMLSPGSATFEVPVFQRAYAWGPEEIGQLLDDVFGQASKSELPYFLGSIVLASRDDDSDRHGDFVLDGQQRLTTVSLIISALIEMMRQSGEDGPEEHNMYLFSRKQKGKRLPKLKLQAADNETFNTLLANPNLYKDKQWRTSKVSTALQHIFKGIEFYSINNTDFSSTSNPYDKMLERLLYDVELVRITAPSEREAFRLFETLNDRGLSLSAADLVKNKLFSSCGNEIDDAVEAWSSMLNSINDDDIVNFLRTYWIAFNGFVRKRGLYDVYRNHIDGLDSTSATLLAIELDKVAKDYEQIISPSSTISNWGVLVNEALERLNLYRARSCRPFLLKLTALSPEEILCGVRICESITVRYSLVGEKNPNLLETIYSEFCRIFREEEEPWRHIFTSKYMDDIPSDREFETKLSEMEINTLSQAWREFLSQINTHLGTGETTIQRDGRVHVEHILPQNPRAVALQESKLTKDEADELVNKLGNLTLLCGKRNRQISNKAFSDKRNMYLGSEILMTRNLYDFDKWEKDNILNRSIELAKIAKNAFLHPREIISSKKLNL